MSMEDSRKSKKSSRQKRSHSNITSRPVQPVLHQITAKSTPDSEDPSKSPDYLGQFL